MLVLSRESGAGGGREETEYGDKNFELSLGHNSGCLVQPTMKKKVAGNIRDQRKKVARCELYGSSFRKDSRRGDALVRSRRSDLTSIDSTAVGYQDHLAKRSSS